MPLQILHRDIKPGNIMLMEGDVVKIGDLGVAKVCGCSTLGLMNSCMAQTDSACHAYIHCTCSAGVEKQPPHQHSNWHALLHVSCLLYLIACACSRDQMKQLPTAYVVLVFLSFLKRS